MDRRQLENVLVRNMILKDKRFDSIKGQIHEDLYNRLRNRKSRVTEEKKRMNMVKKLCIVNSEEEINEILKGMAPLLRNKKRSILLMGGNYEEVNMETQKAIVTYMCTMPNEIEKSAQKEETSPNVVVGSSHNYEKPTKTSIPSDSPHIAIGTESMQVDNTNVTVDRIEDPFKDFGSSIVGNIVDYTSLSEEEKNRRKRKKMHLLKRNLNLALK